MQHKKKCKGFLSIYILYTLKESPKSGYEIIKEIELKTEGWKPSKGALYPTLKELDKEKLIELKDTSSRSKHIYEITKKGKDYLKKIIKQHSKLTRLRILFMEVFNNKNKDIKKLLFEIEKESEKIKNKEEINKILNNALKKIKSIK